MFQTTNYVIFQMLDISKEIYQTELATILSGVNNNLSFDSLLRLTE
jgi:hypothetical protein